VMADECGSASREESLPFGEQTTNLGLSKTGPLVYAKQTTAASLWKWDTSETANPIQVFQSTQDDHTPAYAPDGKRIAFASTRSGSEEIWLSNVDGSSPGSTHVYERADYVEPPFLARRAYDTLQLA
jgi:hypothetical protein